MSTAFATPVVLLRARARGLVVTSKRNYIVIRRPRAVPLCCASSDGAAAVPGQSSISSSGDASISATPNATTQGLVARLRHLLSTLWQFGRPHTIYGTASAISSVTILALQHHALTLLPATSSASAATTASIAAMIAQISGASSLLLPAFLTALVPALLINVFIVGLNQLHDIGIDRVNKPYLPIPAGRLTATQAWGVTLLSLVLGLSFCFAPLATPALRAVLLASVALGTVYSVPPFRLKRFPLLASTAILTVRGALVNVGFFQHIVSAAALAVNGLPSVVCFATAFFTVFGVVIALCKDVPDVRGDRLFGVRTLSVRIGPTSVLRACVVTLGVLFSLAAAYYFANARTLVGGCLSAVTHLATAALLMREGFRVDGEKSAEVSKFYMLSWKAFYLEYLLLPLVGL